MASKRRRSFKTRRTYRKRATALSSQRGNFSGGLYRTRLQPYRKYKSSVYRSLKFKESHRSVQSLTNNITSGTLSPNQKQWYMFELNNAFYLSSGGYTGTGTFSTDKIIIKGGTMYSMVRNVDTSPITVEFALIRLLESGRNPNGVISLNAGDLSTVDGFGQGFKLISKVKRHIVEPNDQCEVKYRIPFKIINDITQWNGDDGNIAIVWSVTGNKSGTHVHFNERGHNLAFCADKINP